MIKEINIQQKHANRRQADAALDITPGKSTTKAHSSHHRLTPSAIAQKNKRQRPVHRKGSATNIARSEPSVCHHAREHKKKARVSRSW